jgi:hypothetical protein
LNLIFSSFAGSAVVLKCSLQSPSSSADADDDGELLHEYLH